MIREDRWYPRAIQGVSATKVWRGMGHGRIHRHSDAQVRVWWYPRHKYRHPTLEPWRNVKTLPARKLLLARRGHKVAIAGARGLRHGVDSLASSSASDPPAGSVLSDTQVSDMVSPEAASDAPLRVSAATYSCYDNGYCSVLSVVNAGVALGLRWRPKSIAYIEKTATKLDDLSTAGQKMTTCPGSRLRVTACGDPSDGSVLHYLRSRTEGCFVFQCAMHCYTYYVGDGGHHRTVTSTTLRMRPWLPSRCTPANVNACMLVPANRVIVCSHRPRGGTGPHSGAYGAPHEIQDTNVETQDK